jgi:hypothetical protein
MVAHCADMQAQTQRVLTSADMALASRRLEVLRLPRFELTSPDFHDGELLPTRAMVMGYRRRCAGSASSRRPSRSR